MRLLNVRVSRRFGSLVRTRTYDPSVNSGCFERPVVFRSDSKQKTFWIRALIFVLTARGSDKVWPPQNEV